MRCLQRCGRQPDDISSIVLVEEDACHIKSEAILRIGRRLRQPFPVGAAPLFVLPGFLRDGFYDQVCFQATAISKLRVQPPFSARTHSALSGVHSNKHAASTVRPMVILTVLHGADCGESLQCLWEAGRVPAAA